LVSAIIEETLAAATYLAITACDIGTWITDAIAFDACFTFWAMHTTTGVRHASTINTGFKKWAGNLSAAWDTLTIPTELPHLTLGRCTRIRQTLDTITDGAVWAARCNAVVRFALTVPAPLAFGAFWTVCTRVDTLGCCWITLFVERAFNTIARSDAQAFLAITNETLHQAFIAGTRVTTLTFKTYFLPRARLTLVRLSIAIIIDAVTLFLTNFIASPTGADEIFIDNLITIIVEAVAHFRIRAKVGYTNHHAVYALSCPFSTESGLTRRTGTRCNSTGTIRSFVDPFIAVIIQTVAQIR
jgi:hypothetical protein